MSAVLEAARVYAARGWQAHQLHGVRADGTCTCRKAAACAGSTGKHPVDVGWQDRRRPVGDVLADYDRRPWATNIGILTGGVSGLFVLDVDPDNGGHATLARLEDEHGTLPPTYTVRTGGDGWHFYFLLPDEALRNSAGAIGGGLDTRSDGGQVVAPPSVSAKGVYIVEADRPVVGAPAWLLRLLQRPPTPKAQGLSHRPRPGSVVGRAAGVLSFLLAAPEGQRNGRLFWASCRFGEMAAEGLLGELEAADLLRDAGSGLGLPDTEMLGAQGGAGTIWSGLRAGREAGAVNR